MEYDQIHEPGLYIVGTPIGNRADLSIRAVALLKQANLIFAEDTRHTRKLLEPYGITTHCVSCHKFNEASRIETINNALEAGQTLVLVSDSGMPGVSDPGSRIVKACRESGMRVSVIPGPSAVTSAIALSGWGDGGFIFDGFLSHKSATRRNRLRVYTSEARAVVLFESPHRIIRFLEDVREVLGDRPVFIGRELTKKFEETCCGTAQELIDHFDGRSIKGEFVVVLAPV
ncbi:MAG: 16S rRNA (cytidine1402-2'-O)-methyltransferase [Kiritimatiellia bacterium]|jgi:16S rRNA (cytidine1402-2'-O)-methyltransferase